MSGPQLLVLNCGSSSLKFDTFEASPALTPLGGGEIEHAGSGGLERALNRLLEGDRPERLAAVGHRLVHGGEQFVEPVRIDAAVARKLQACAALAPLQMEPAVAAIQSLRARLPRLAQVGVFDTAFHRTLPARAWRYALPRRLRDRYPELRRYGFHGLSHRYLLGRYAELAGKPPEACTLITCHLGSGSSLCAIANGVSVDTSMGFSPLSGVVMGTRCGDLDPGGLLYLMEKESLSPAAANALLNRECGMLGLSGVSADFRELRAAAEAGRSEARDALDQYAYQVTRYAGAYLAALGGAEAVIFAGGIGEHDAALRAAVCAPLAGLGLRLESAANQQALGREARISAPGSAIAAWVLPTREDLIVARDTWALLERKKAGPGN